MNLTHRSVSERQLKRMVMPTISKAAAQQVESAGNSALCDGETSIGLSGHEVAIAGHWGNVEQALSLLPEAIRAVGDDDRELTRRRVCWQVERD